MHVGGEFDRGTVGWYVTEITRGGLSRMAVPYFFLASGFFLAGHVGEQGWWKREARKRIGTLLIPLVIWCLIGTIWGAFWTACANYLAGRPLGYDIPFCNGEWVPGVGILWFVRNLFLLVLVSKAIAWMIERIGWVWIGVCFAIYWSVYTCLNPVKPDLAWQGFLVYGFSLEGLSYFSLGIRANKSHSINWTFNPKSSAFWRATSNALVEISDAVSWQKLPVSLARASMMAPLPVPISKTFRGGKSLGESGLLFAML